MKLFIQSTALTTIGLLLAGTVYAHVSVNPKEVLPGYSVATIRVPNEKEVATTQVRVIIPQGVTVGGVMPLAGWVHSEKKEADPKKTPVMHDDGDTEPAESITEITWSGGKIGAGEFMEFPLSVQYSGDVDAVKWKAYQTYAGGEVVSWDGSSDKNPAAVVTILKDSKTAPAGGAGTTATPPSGASTWLSVLAVVVSVAALAVSSKKKS